MTDKARTLAEVLRAAFDARDSRLRVCMPARVIAFNAALLAVDVKPVVFDIIEAEDGELPEALPVILNVPVQYPCGGGFRIVFPLQPGDFVTLVVADRSIDEWRQTGTDAIPQDLRKHDLSDSIAIPGLVPTPGIQPLFPVTDLAIGNSAGGVFVKANGDVALGSAAATKGAARTGDAVQVTFDTGTLLVGANSPVYNSAPVVVTGQITGGSAHVRIKD